MVILLESPPGVVFGGKVLTRRIRASSSVAAGSATLRTPHVALATKRLKQDRFRLGEFVPMVHGKSLRGDAQKDGVMDPPTVLKTNAAVDLKLYRDKKPRPEC